ncbi:unnamed protein product, partial [Prorocentrum cordatum]
GIDELCAGPLCDMFGARDESGQGATEFTMYTLWAMSRTERPRVHLLRGEDGPRSHQDRILHRMGGRPDGQVGRARLGPVLGHDRRRGGLPHQVDARVGGGPAHEVPVPHQGRGDLTQRWAASLWRGMPEQAELLTEVNLETLGAVIGGKSQNPIMFGAQPASLNDMPAAKKQEATDLLVKLYTKAGLYDSSKTPEDLVECVVGLKN